MKMFCWMAIAILAVTSFFSCTIENSYLKPYGSSNPDSTGKSTTSTTGSDSTYNGAITNNYQPDSANSEWTYQVHQVFNFSNSTFATLEPSEVSVFSGLDMDSTITYHVEALGIALHVKSLIYQEYSNDYYGGIFAPVIAFSNGNYTGVDQVWEVLWLEGSSFGGFSLNDDTLLYLEENQPVGSAWNQTTIVTDAYGFQDTTNYAFSIKATGISRSVNAITYSNVIQVESKTIPSAFAFYASAFAAQGTDMSTTTDYYFAKNVGLIEEDLAEPFMGITLNASLVASTIK